MLFANSNFCFFTVVKSAACIFFCVILLCLGFNIKAQDSIASFTQDTNLNTTASFIDTTAKKDSILIAIPYLIADSVLQSILDTVKHTVKWQASPPSIYANHQAGKIISNVKSENNLWLFVFFFLQLIMLAYLKTNSLKNLEDSLNAYFNINLAQQLLREQEGVITISGIIQMLNFLISCSILVFLALTVYFKIDYYNTFCLFTIIFLFISIIYFAKYAGYKMLSYVFPFKDELNNFRFNYFLNQKLLGFALLPFIYAAAYNTGYWSSFFLVAAIALFFISILIRSSKGIIIGLKQLQKNTFHFLLYICAFEIAPVLILLKWLQMVGYGQ